MQFLIKPKEFSTKSEIIGKVYKQATGIAGAFIFMKPFFAVPHNMLHKIIGWTFLLKSS